jgi:hypothetical protein
LLDEAIGATQGTRSNRSGKRVKPAVSQVEGDDLDAQSLDECSRH